MQSRAQRRQYGEPVERLLLSIRYGQRHTRGLEARFVNITCSPLQIRSSRVHVPPGSSPVPRRCPRWNGQPISRCSGSGRRRGVGVESQRRLGGAQTAERQGVSPTAREIVANSISCDTIRACVWFLILACSSRPGGPAWAHHLRSSAFSAAEGSRSPYLSRWWSSMSPHCCATFPPRAGRPTPLPSLTTCVLLRTNRTSSSCGVRCFEIRTTIWWQSLRSRVVPTRLSRTT